MGFLHSKEIIMNAHPTYYEILSVEPTATAEEIKKAHSRARRMTHPDLNSGVDSGLFVLVDKAYQVLSDEHKRAEYDASLLNNDTPPQDYTPPHDRDRHTTEFFETMPYPPTPNPTQPPSTHQPPPPPAPTHLNHLQTFTRPTISAYMATIVILAGTWLILPTRNVSYLMLGVAIIVGIFAGFPPFTRKLSLTQPPKVPSTGIIILWSIILGAVSLLPLLGLGFGIAASIRSIIIIKRWGRKQRREQNSVVSVPIFSSPEVYPR